jgi:hypothetical protein
MIPTGLTMTQQGPRPDGANQCNFVRSARLAGQERAPNRVRAKVDFLRQFKLIGRVQSRRQKITFRKSEIVVPCAIPSHQEGRWPSSRTLGRDAVDAAAAQDERR